jgi:hypothetical protein
MQGKLTERKLLNDWSPGMQTILAYNLLLESSCLLQGDGKHWMIFQLLYPVPYTDAQIPRRLNFFCSPIVHADDRIKLYALYIPVKITGCHYRNISFHRAWILTHMCRANQLCSNVWPTKETP